MDLYRAGGKGEHQVRGPQSRTTAMAGQPVGVACMAWIAEQASTLGYRGAPRGFLEHVHCMWVSGGPGYMLQRPGMLLRADRGAGNSTDEEDAVPASFSPKPGEPTAEGVALCGSPAWPGNAEATIVVRAARLKLGAWSFASLAIRCRRLACPCKRRLLVPGFHGFQSPKAPPRLGISWIPGCCCAAFRTCSRQPRICIPP